MRELRYIFALLVALLVAGCSQTIVFEEDDVTPTPTPTPPVEETIQNNEIWYTSTNGAVVTPYADDVFNSTITSNTYSNGKGVIKFSSALTRIGDYAFYNCRNLATVTLPDGIREIESGSFSCCSNLTEFNSKYASSDKRCLIINNQLVAFAPSGVTEYDISEGVAAIGNAVFADCKNITTVTISDDVTSIGFDAFKNCSKLLNVYCKPTTPPTLTDASAFAGNATDRMIYVWGASLAAYRSAQRWSDYADAIHGYDFNTGRFDEIPSELHIVGAYQNSDINAPHSTLVQVDDSRLAGFFYVPSQEKNGFKLYEINAAGNLNKIYSKVNGKISVSSIGDDITLGAGLHYLVFDYYNMVLTDTSITRLGIIGDAVGNWDSDCGVFVYDDENSRWSVTIDNVEADKEYKIRCNNGWDIVLGGTASDIKVGTDVSSIKTTQSGTVKFTLNLFDSPYTVTEEKVESSLETISVAFTTVDNTMFPEAHGLPGIYLIAVSNEAGDSGQLLFYDNTTPFVALSGEYQTVVGTLGNEFKTPCLLADPGYCSFYIGGKIYYPVSGSVTVTTAMPDMDTNGFDFNLVVEEDESKRQYALKGALDNNIVGAFGYVGTSYTDMDLAAWGFTTFEATFDASNTNLVRLTSTNANGNFVIELTTSDGDITNGVYSVSDGTLSGYYFDGLDAKEYVFQDGQIMFEKVNGNEKKYKLLVSSRAGDWLIGDKYKVVVPSVGYYSITINSLNSTTGYVVPENAKRHTIEIDLTLGSYTNIASQVNIAHLVQGATAQEVKMAYLDSNNRLAWQNWSITDGWFGVYGACSWGETECVACIKPNVDGSFEYVCAYPEREAGTTATAILDYGNNIIVAITVVLVKPTTIPNNEIWYTSVGDNVLNLKNTNAFGSEFVSHRFENGKGIITCAGDITEIGYEAFSVCDKMLTITIPNSVTAIGNYAFLGCNSLPAITLPENLTSIGSCAFSNCKALTEVEIPQSVTTINDYAFQGCTSLTEVTIPQSVTTFGYGVFNDCASMKTFNGKYATSDHLALVVDGVLNSFALGSGDIEYTIPTGVTEISSSVFSNSTILGKLTIPAAVTKVGVAAFYNCDKLTELVVEDSSTSLMERAFSGCDALEKVTIGKENLRSMMASVTKQAQQFATAVIAPALPISKEAFAECGKLKEVTIGEGVTAIGDEAFDKCYSLVTVNCKPTTPPTLDSYSDAFRDNADSRKIYVHALSLNAYKTAEGWKDYADAIVADPNTEVSPNQQIFYTSTDGNIVTPYKTDVFGANIVSNTYENGRGVITFDGPVTQIGTYAFYRKSQLTSVTLPESVTSIDTQSFGACQGLTSFTIPNSVTNVLKAAFLACYNLAEFYGPAATDDHHGIVIDGRFCAFTPAGPEEYAIEEGVTTIIDGAFNDCGKLKKVTIPSTVVEIQEQAFYRCYALTTVNCKPIIPPTLLMHSSYGTFDSNATGRKIYVPAGSVDAYKTASGWRVYADAIEADPESVVEVDLSQYTDLSAEGTANCYLVKSTGKYKFQTVKGNSTTSVGDAQSASVLWETFGTDVMPNVGDLVRSVGYKDGYVYFSTPETFANGNASIAVHDTNNTILWSWHIWCSAEGWEDDVYANNAGTMMDRNLGATSATPGSVGALGLMYQWGRKDPFLSSSSISANNFAVSTGNWTTNSSQQTVEYACQNPTIFICPIEWCTGDGSGDSNYALRWKDTEKTAYDPCPVGYRVPKGGSDCLWKTSETTTSWDSSNKGRNWTLADGTTAWYPAVGYRSCNSGALVQVGSGGCYWSASPYPSDSSYYACYLLFYNGNVNPASDSYRGYGYSVRCFREGSDSGSSTPDPEIPATPGNRTIMTVADLQNFIAAVNAGDYSAWKSSDGEVKLGADLDLAGADLTPIESFDGVFNGQNFALKNWKTTRGLFDQNTGVVKNVIIDATCTLTVAYDSTGDKQSGFIAENNQPTGVVSGCVNHGFVKSTDVSCAGHRIGGVVGVSYGMMNDCINYGEVYITSEAVNSSLYIGGVVGFINTNASTKDALGADFLVNCINRGKVTVLFPSLPKKVFVGGVLGGTKTDASTTATYLGQIKNCVNHGEVSYRFETLSSGTYGNVGGVIGYAQANMENCDNYGEVSYTTPTDPSAAGTRAAAGGVVGCNIFGITNCNNYGELFVEGVWASGTNDAAAAGSQAGSSFGGVVGCVGVYNTYKADYPTVGCNNYGKVDLNVACKTAGGTAGYFAGVLGYSTNDVEDCHNYGEVNIWTYLANTYLAGVVGYTTASVDNLTNNNVVNLEVEGVTAASKTLYPAGVVGRAKAIANCVNNGETNVVVNPCEIAISTIYGGGVAGYVETKIENSTLNAPFSLTTADNQASLRCAGVVGQAKTGTAPTYTAINCNTTEKATITLNTKNTKANYIGGIMGYCSNGLDNCTNKASIDVTFAEPNTGTSIVYVAGVSGNQKETMNNCHNEGNISVDMGESTCPLYAATLVGMNHTSACVVKDCTNSGNLEIVNYAGESQVVGIFGGNNPKTETDGVVTEEVTFENCTNTGIVTVNGTRVE